MNSQKKTPGTGRSDEEEQNTAQGSSSSSSASSSSPGNGSSKSSSVTRNAIELLKADHRKVEQLFSQFQATKGRQQMKKLVEQIATALTVHAIVEEEIFYRACRQNNVDEDELDEAQVEHDTVKMLVRDLLESASDDDYYQAKVSVLKEYVKHHVGEEEKPSDGIFARAQSAGIDMDALGEKLQARKDELMADERRLWARPPKIRSLHITQHSQEYSDMARYSSDREREEHGRFMSDDYGSGRHSSGRGGYRGYEEDEYRGSSGARGGRMSEYRGGMQGGGRYASDEDYGDYGRSRAGGYEDEYRRSAYGSPGYGASGYRGGMQGGGRNRDFDEDYERHGHGQGQRHLGYGGEERDYYQGSGSRYGSSNRSRDYEDEDEDRGSRYYGGSQGGDYGRGQGGDYGRSQGGDYGRSGSYRGGR